VMNCQDKRVGMRNHEQILESKSKKVKRVDLRPHLLAFYRKKKERNQTKRQPHTNSLLGMKSTQLEIKGLESREHYI